jgi:6,7-dimethyl-8-ribityllumazine synthase
MKVFEGILAGASRSFVIVVSRWNELVTKELLEGALDEFRRYSFTEIEVVRVPGSWEIPLAVKKILGRETPPAAIVALGCILQGQTPHAKLLGSDVAGSLMSLQLEHGVPISWGILTPDTAEQAFDRAGMKLGNKGREAAGAAIEMASLLEQL